MKSQIINRRLAAYSFNWKVQVVGVGLWLAELDSGLFLLRLSRWRTAKGKSRPSQVQTTGDFWASESSVSSRKISSIMLEPRHFDNLTSKVKPKNATEPFPFQPTPPEVCWLGFSSDLM